MERSPHALLRNQQWLLNPNIDYIISHYLIMRDNRSDFFFIQIGAFDGISGDAIFKFVQRFGWKGVLVEPQERYFDQLRINYAGCDGLKFLKVAIAAERGVGTLYSLVDPEAPGLPSWAPQIASFSLDTVLRHRGVIPNIESRIKEEHVECITFEDLIKEAGTDNVDLLQIDVEGYDHQILKMIDFGRISPNIIRFEHKHLNKKDQDAALALLGNAGYHILREGADTIAYRLG